ncbi:MAG: HDOD domain-containing protein [Acidobacteriaceae bacterium]|nr:HDOD domain-containing protein [Acidobacteriaceae bacterium]
MKDADIEEMLQYLSDDLQSQASEIGARDVIARIEQSWSHVFRVGRRHGFRFETSETIEHIFRRVISNSSLSESPFRSAEQVLAVARTLPVDTAVAAQALSALADPFVEARAIEAILMRDPTVAAHLLRLANSALYAFESEVRSVSHALMRVGTDKASLLIAALVARKAYSAPHCREVWNHSVDVADIAAQICRQVPSISESEVTLAALVHDIGRLAFLSSDEFLVFFRAAQTNGDYLVEAERSFCGVDHSEIGGMLLDSWHWPGDMVAAVRNHHSPDLSSTLSSQVLCLAEHVSGSDEHVPNLLAPAIAANLGIDIQNIVPPSMNVKSTVAQLRFAAAAA